MATTKKTIETTNDKKDKISVIEIIQDIDTRLTKNTFQSLKKMD